jgi:hypothetical protein
MTVNSPSAWAALTKASIPPPSAIDLAFDQSNAPDFEVVAGIAAAVAAGAEVAAGMAAVAAGACVAAGVAAVPQAASIKAITASAEKRTTKRCDFITSYLL